MKKMTLFALLLIVLQSNVPYAPAGKISKPGSGKLLSDWIGVHLQLVRTGKGLTQAQLFRQFAYCSVAFYESLVPGDKKYQSLAGQVQELEQSPQVSGSRKMRWEAGASATMAAMLEKFYGDNPVAMKKIDSMETACRQKFIKEGMNEEELSATRQYGASVATAIVKWADADGSMTKYPDYEIPKGDGRWEPTPPGFSSPAGPFLSRNRTCIKNSTDNTLPPAPASFSSDPASPFYKMVKEVYDVSVNLRDEERSIALFWDDFPDGRYFGASGHWSSILKQVIDNRKLSLIEAAQAYATMHIAMIDAVNGCWKAKYTYNMMRPVTFIHKYMGRKDWMPLIVTPNHPEYPAAHATISMAAATALNAVLGNNISFTDHSYDDLGYRPRTFRNFEEAGREAGMSRLYGGIHYRPSIEAGYKLGAAVSANVLAGLRMKK